MYNPKKGEILADLFNVDQEDKECFFKCVQQISEKFKKNIETAKYIFELGMQHIENEEFLTASQDFQSAARMYGLIKHMRKEALSLELRALCLLKKRPALPYTAENDLETAIKIYEMLEDAEGIKRINKLLARIVEKKRNSFEANYAILEFPKIKDSNTGTVKPEE